MATSSRRQVFLHPGDQLGGYTIEEVLGAGGMAVVYRATQRSLQRQVALKVLNASLSRNDEFRLRFQREGARVANLDHEHIVSVYDLDEADGSLYMAMRLVDGETLADRMLDGLSADETVSILGDIAEALDAAHAAGVLHRDVKPHNILLEGDRRYLADFGIAKGSETTALTRTGGFVGSFHYASPEQFLGGELTTASDVYSLAAVAYECLTGEPPSGKGSEASVLDRRLHHAPPPLAGPKLSNGGRALSAVLQRGLAREPADRPQHPLEFAAELTQAVRRLSAAERSRRPAFPASAGRDGRRAAASAPALITAPAHTADVPAGEAAHAETIDAPRGSFRSPGAGVTAHDPRTSAPRPVATPPSGSRRRPRVAPAPVALACAALMLPLGAWKATQPDAARTLQIAGATAAVPASWSAQRGDPAMFAGLKVGEPIAQAAHRSPQGLRVVALARVARSAFTLAPTGAGPVERLRLGSALAYRYDAGSSARVRRLVTVIPAADAAIVVGCRLPAGDAASLELCDRAVGSTSGGRGLTPSTEQKTTTAITAALAPVRRALQRPLPTTAARRATAARQLAERYAAAADRLSSLARGARWDADLAAAARRATAVGGAYGAIAAAAERRRAGSDRTATDQLREADAALRQSLTRMADRDGSTERT
jgi:serine/threonine-protein kinase